MTPSTVLFDFATGRCVSYLLQYGFLIISETETRAMQLKICCFERSMVSIFVRRQSFSEWSWSSPGLVDTFSLMKESVFHAENEEPVPDGI